MGELRALTEINLERVASVLTPHDLEVDGADRAVTEEDSVEGLEVCVHNCRSVITTTEGSIWVEEGACCS